jgi:hypothetical protein
MLKPYQLLVEQSVKSNGTFVQLALIFGPISNVLCDVVIRRQVLFFSRFFSGFLLESLDSFIKVSKEFDQQQF